MFLFISDCLQTVVIFRASFSKDKLSVPSGTVVFDYIMENVGKGYNPDTGFFTAPVQGLYVFTVQGYSDGAQEVNWDLHITENSGSSYLVMQSRGLTTSDESVVSVYATSLNIHDKIFVFSKSTTKHSGSRASFFSGWLVKNY